MPTLKKLVVWAPYPLTGDQLTQQADVLDVGRRVIRNYLPDQHREFYTQLPFVLVGSIDTLGRPWASVPVSYTHLTLPTSDLV